VQSEPPQEVAANAPITKVLHYPTHGHTHRETHHAHIFEVTTGGLSNDLYNLTSTKNRVLNSPTYSDSSASIFSASI